MVTDKSSLPEEFASIEAVQAFWETHSSVDYWDEMQDVDVHLSPSLQARLETQKLYRLLGLSTRQVSVIKEEAQRNHTDTRRLITHWVLEHVPVAAERL
jgi:hypothetical protein